MMWTGMDENMEPMEVFYEEIPKEMITTLPIVTFEGRIITIDTETEARKAVSYLEREKIVGLDTETRPSFKKGQSNKVALLQLSTMDTCFLFRLNCIGLPDDLFRFLENSEILKVGLSLNDDIRALGHRKELTLNKHVDIQDMAGEIGIKDKSLQKIYANLFGGKISKHQKLSNWEADVLSPSQKKYAAIDAWACLLLYQKLLNMKGSRNYTLKKYETDE